MFLDRYKHFYVFYNALFLDIEDKSTHIHMEKLLERSPDVSDLVNSFRVLAATLLSARGASAPVAVEMAKAREAPKRERQAPKARGGVGRHRGGSRGPTCYVQDGQDQSGHEQESCPPRR